MLGSNIRLIRLLLIIVGLSSRREWNLGVYACSRMDYHMVPTKSLDDSYKLIAALLRDVHNVHGVVFNSRSLRLTLEKVRKRLFAEGIGFLTKTLPRLGKAFDKAISGAASLNCETLGFDRGDNTELPRFLGEFFSKVLQQDGTLQQRPCAESVRVIRQVLYLFYKYELPYSDEQEQQIIQKFERTEDDLSTLAPTFEETLRLVQASYSSRKRYHRFGDGITTKEGIARVARDLLGELFATFDPRDINPRHGPGAVATKQKLWAKYQWSNVSANITQMYPLDEYYYASLGHVCDRLDTINSITDEDLPARVILVPKDSRGPRLISCEPVDYQWIQQGLGRAIVELVECHPLTKWNVHFTDQEPNRRGAILGSKEPTDPTLVGRYSTLDLNEASDRVSLDLVRLLFPERIIPYLEACRSSSTVLPDGRVIKLRKFAPMGSCLCFPVLALTVWAILTAAAPDQDTSDGILVYGDDVIVPTAYAESAMMHLESFGLKVNRDKSCTSGLFRESCGMDAFNGIDVTPVRLRTVWSSSRQAGVYSSWIAYANSFYDRQYYCVYNLIVDRLISVYGNIPDDDMSLTCPSLRCVPENSKPHKRRINKALQKVEYYVWDVKAPSINKVIDGWSMLLRYFSEFANQVVWSPEGASSAQHQTLESDSVFTASQYTSRSTSMLVRRWR